MEDIKNAYKRIMRNKGVLWSENASIVSKWQIISFTVVSVLIIIGAYSGFLPGNEYYNISLYISLPVSLNLSIPTTLLLFKGRLLVFVSMPKLLPSKSNKTVFVIFTSLLFWFACHIAIAEGLGSLLHKIQSSQHSTNLSIEKLSKHLHYCRYRVTFTAYTDRSILKSLCLDDEKLFLSLIEQEKVELQGTRSWFGFKVDRIIRKEQHAFPGKG